MRSLEGAVALVTGARGGIGGAACTALAEAGATVVGTGRGDAPKDLRAHAWFHHDVTSPDDWKSVIQAIALRFGRLDCLVNNAGIYLVELIARTSIEQWRQVLSVNVESVVLGVQASLPLLRESGANRMGGSSIVNVSSTAGLRGVPFNGAYCASKGAMTLLSKSLAKEFAALRYPIRVNSIHPGGVETQMTDGILARYVEIGLAESVQAQKQAWEAARPLGRSAQAAEIAGAAVFLCSSAASFMTGSELVIDGGVTA